MERKWELAVGEQYCFHPGNRVAVVCHGGEEDDSESTVAEVWPDHDGRDIIDGRLIAAAPELLAALKAMYEPHAKGWKVTDWALRLEQAEQAIARAEGRFALKQNSYR